MARRRARNPGLKRLRGLPSWERVVEAVEAIKAESWNAFSERHGDWGRDLALLLGQKRFRCYSLTTTKAADKVFRLLTAAATGIGVGFIMAAASQRRLRVGWSWVHVRKRLRKGADFRPFAEPCYVVCSAVEPEKLNAKAQRRRGARVHRFQALRLCAFAPLR